MFKEGDQVICISEFGPLVLNRIYTIRKILVTHYPKTPTRLCFNEVESTYNPDRFKLLSEHRREQIERIKHNIKNSI